MQVPSHGALRVGRGGPAVGGGAADDESPAVRGRHPRDDSPAAVLLGQAVDHLVDPVAAAARDAHGRPADHDPARDRADAYAYQDRPASPAPKLIAVAPGGELGPERLADPD